MYYDMESVGIKYEYFSSKNWRFGWRDRLLLLDKRCTGLPTLTYILTALSTRILEEVGCCQGKILLLQEP